jgi:tetratricopeptide (TPR) repeat protein
MADCKILFITANDNERKAFLNKDLLLNQEDIDCKDGLMLTYGDFGKYRVAHYHSKQGTNAQAEISRAIEASGAKYVILVGIACGGMEATSENIGEVLVAESIIDYDTYKAAKDKKEHRGAIPFTGDTLYRAFNGRGFRWTEETKTECHFGQIISSAVLLDNEDIKKEIFGEFDNNPIGYEMEGISAARACKDKHISELLVVKGISDLGDGNKKRNKEENQGKAAKNAVDLCHYIFSNAIFGDTKEDKKEVKKTEETYLPSSFLTPKADMVGRVKDIRTIHNKFEDFNIIALHGDGGIGKTVTAELYAKEYKDEYKTINHLQFSRNVIDTLINLTNEWNLPNFENLTYEQKGETIKRTLKNLTYKILIVIHINDESITELSDNVNLKYNKNVKFLFTTRRNSLPPCSMIEIKPLSDDEIKQIFINNACEEKYRAVIEKEIEDHSEQFDEIVKIYCKNTMLITLAARIKNVANKSISELCELIKKDSLASAERTSIEIIKDGDLPVKLPLSEHIKNLYSIAHLSEEQVDFLRNMSLMDYGGVPLDKFMEWMQLIDFNTEVSLENNGFIHCNLNSIGKKIIYMHPAVSDAVFEQTGANSVTCEEFFVNLFRMEKDPNYLHEKRYLLSISEFICERISSEETYVKALCYGLSGGLYTIFGYYKKALEYYIKDLNMCSKLFGVDNPDVGSLYNSIGFIYYNLAEYDKALEYYNKSFIINENGIDRDHLNTATLYNNIGTVYTKTGDHGKALEYSNKALEIREKVLGVEHPDTAASYNNIGSIYNDRQENEKAFDYFTKALIVFEKVLGANHPKTATLYNNIGYIHQERSEYEEALEYYMKSLRIREKIFESDHIDIITIYLNISITYYDMGDPEKAFEYRLKAEQAQSARDKEYTGV